MYFKNVMKQLEPGYAGSVDMLQETLLKVKNYVKSQV
jgi:hypothetical protein